MPDTVLVTFSPEYPFQPGCIGAGQYIGIAVAADIARLQPREMTVQGSVKLVPVSLPQGQAHAKMDDPLHPGIGAEAHDAADIFLGIVEERQNGT